jgi:hypothetical protein
LPAADAGLAVELDLGLASSFLVLAEEGHLGPLRFAASAEASLVREKSCHLVIGDMRAGDRIVGYLD